MYAVSPFTSLLIFTFFFSLPSNIQSFSSYENCAKRFNCGKFRDLDYPFWGGVRPRECGHPEFELKCKHDGVATIVIKNVVYRVLEINNTTDEIKVARDDFFDDGICTSKFVSTSIDDSLFEYTGGEYTNVTILYGCPSSSTAGYDLPFCHIHQKNVDVVIGPEGLGACNKSVTVPVLGIEIERHKGTNFSWLSDVIRDHGFMLKWKNVYWRCAHCRGTGEKCGFDSGLQHTTCFCPGDERYDRAICRPPPSRENSVVPAKKKKNFSNVLLIVGIILGIVSAVLFFGIRQLKKKLIAECKSKGLRITYELDEFMRNYGSLAPKQYSYSDVKRITKSFADKLGQGGYGSVYKGKLSDGRPVAVKILNESKGNGQEFLNEVASISRTSHVNVVSLLGFCYKGTTKRALLYEFMPNSSLDKFIYHEKQSPNTNIELDRTALSKIAIGIARGLEYLHSGCNTRILHLDIKPHNILLDQDWCPKISDFGLAKLCQRKDSMVSTMPARGTIGYIAPEVFNRAFGRVSYKSDVYSYGMMILEMAGVGKTAEIEGLTETSEMYFPDWIYKKLEGGPDGVALRDNEITGEDKDKEMERKMILVGLWCIQTKPADRPSMAKVIEMLEGSSDLLQTPPKPFLFPPTSRSPTRIYSSSSLSSTSQIIGIQP